MKLLILLSFCLGFVACIPCGWNDPTCIQRFFRSAPEPSYVSAPEPNYVLVPSYVPEPEPAPTYNAPEPASTYTEPEPAPTYIELEPALTYTKPKPAYKEAKKTRKNLKRKIRKNLKRKMRKNRRKNRRKNSRKNRRKDRRKNRRKNGRKPSYVVAPEPTYVLDPSYLRGNTNLENQSLLTHSSKTTLLFSIPIRSNSCHSTQTKKGILFNLMSLACQ